MQPKKVSTPLTTRQPVFPTYVRLKVVDTYHYGDVQKLLLGTTYRVARAIPQNDRCLYLLWDISSQQLMSRQYDHRDFELLHGGIGFSTNFPVIGKNFSFKPITAKGLGRDKITSKVIAIESISQNVTNIVTKNSVYTILSSQNLLGCSSATTYVRWNNEKSAYASKGLKSGVFYRVRRFLQERGVMYYYVQEVISGNDIPNGFKCSNFELLPGFLGISSNLPKIGEEFIFNKITPDGNIGSKQSTSKVIAIEPVSQNVLNVITMHSVHTVLLDPNHKA